MKTSNLYLLVVVFQAASAVPTGVCSGQNEIGPTIRTEAGTILGNTRDVNGILTFKGVPYAAPPVGNLRWHSPEPPTRFSGVLNTTAYGASCYASTTAELPYFTPPNEDCLFLNVWTGAVQSFEKRPVMVFIPGGGFQFGSAAQPAYDGTNLAKLGVVIVTMNYRLGVFGYLALDELDREGTNSGDYGLQDQIAALQWVRNNIAAFGGDPEQVTLFGESAGAMSVGMLMTSRLTAGLFSKAILESGALWDSAAGPLETFEQARARGAVFEASIGATSVAQLRAMSATAVNAAAPWSPTTDPKITAFAPSIDNFVLSCQPGMAFADGLQHRIPLLGGFNGDEGLIFDAYGLSETNAMKYQDGLKDYFSARESEALTLYPDSTPALLKASANQLVGDMTIREQTYTALNYQRVTPGVPRNSVFAYYFTYQSPYSPIAIHTAELSFVFGNLAPNPEFGPDEGPATAQDAAFSKTVMTYWTNFAKTGNPNGAGVPLWPAYAGDGLDFLDLADTVSTINYDAAGLNFIASFRANGVLPFRWETINVTYID